MNDKKKDNKKKRSPVQGWMEEAEAVKGCQGAVVALCLCLSLVLA
jgi:hypothetical protein